MYYDYFGLNQAPFKITPDTKLFFPGGNRGAILDALIYAIVSGEGIIKVIGEVGSGKTMLCRMLEMDLPDNVEIVYLANPSLSPDNILHAIAFELKLPVKPNDQRPMQPIRAAALPLVLTQRRVCAELSVEVENTS
ncbi:MAG: AAA family ATPase, partial [Gammaproteobacteria bacterium]